MSCAHHVTPGDPGDHTSVGSLLLLAYDEEELGALGAEGQEQQLEANKEQREAKQNPPGEEVGVRPTKDLGEGHGWVEVGAVGVGVAHIAEAEDLREEDGGGDGHLVQHTHGPPQPHRSHL